MQVVQAVQSAADFVAPLVPVVQTAQNVAHIGAQAINLASGVVPEDMRDEYQCPVADCKDTVFVIRGVPHVPCHKHY